MSPHLPSSFSLQKEFADFARCIVRVQCGYSYIYTWHAKKREELMLQSEHKMSGGMVREASASLLELEEYM